MSDWRNGWTFLGEDGAIIWDRLDLFLDRGDVMFTPEECAVLRQIVYGKIKWPGWPEGARPDPDKPKRDREIARHVLLLEARPKVGTKRAVAETMKRFGVGRTYVLECRAKMLKGESG